MLNKIIFYSFALIFFLVPLTWSPLNYELFEYSKMMLTYFLTIAIVGAWLLKSISQKQLVIKRTPLDIPLLLFLGSQILSTIFSIDQHTSIFGYYSRQNGGLLSLIAYLLLYWAFVSNISKEQIFRLLKFSFIAGLIISLWGIAEHFGVSPSCVMLRGEFDATCWVQDVQARVFATLGQPNWMAAYICMLIFPSWYFAITAKAGRQTIIYSLLTIIFYLSFTFTYSRGPMLGFLAGLAVFVSFWLVQNQLWRRKAPPQNDMTKPILVILASFLLLNILFGSALTSFRLVSKFTPPPRPTLSIATAAPATTQLENGGTESGEIRLIVWGGALEIFRHYPILGSGVETFAYAYDRFRPLKHNLVSEWDFLYNKAHNEYLNYLSTTGILGFGTYMLFIGTFLFWCFRYIVTPNKAKGVNLLILAILASYISYLVQDFFLFSVVSIATLFFLFPALVFILADSTKPSNQGLPKIILDIFSLPNIMGMLLSHFFNLPPYARLFLRRLKLGKGFVIIISVYFLFSVVKFWYADTLFASGEKLSESGSGLESYDLIAKASFLNGGEPLYVSELGYDAAQSAVALSETDATLSAKLKNQAISQTQKVLSSSPSNTSFYKTAVRTYYQLSSLNPKFTQTTLDTLDKTLILSPTDPKLYYNKAIILGSVNRNQEAILALQKAIQLKANYREAYLALGLFYFDTKDYPKAVANMGQVLKLVPNDPEALQHLNSWGKQGIATESGIAQ